MFDSALRRLVRDQWIRIHGTPRVTVLVGGAPARELWKQWLTVSGVIGTLLEGDFDRDIRVAAARAADEPAHPIAVLAAPDIIARWRTGRHDRLAAMVDEGLMAVDGLAPSGAAAPRARAGDPGSEPDGSPVTPSGGLTEAAGPLGVVAPRAGTPPSPAPQGPGPTVSLDARSVAEATLFEGLEATAATAGRFVLNDRLSIRFGAQAAEVDLLSRADLIAIEIDGIHHFADPECYRRDRRKDLLLQTQGLLVVRLLAEDVLRDVRSAVNVVSQALAFRRADGRR